MTAPPGDRGLLERLLGPEVVTREGAIPRAPLALHPEEEACIAGARPERRREFAAGRALARAALAELGLPDAAIPRGSPGASASEARLPCWPAGVVGTISHTRRRSVEYCAVAVARSGDVLSLGLDVEVRGAVGPALRPRVLRPEELAALGALETEQASLHASLAFSAKEAFYKSQFPLTGRVLGFHAASVEFDLGAGTFSLTLQEDVGPRLRAGGVLQGRLAVDEDLVVTAVEIRPGAAGG